MSTVVDAVARTEAPTDRPTRTIDVRRAGPPEPLVETLETLAELDERTVLVQRNDRVPRHLFPKLEERGYAYDTVEAGGETVTAVWTPTDEP
jgi:uncharacterized protein (DUF2249 family)